jgi:predicted permease
MQWLKQMFTRRRRYDELSETIREHLEEKIADLMDDGMTREEAERSARSEFGNVTLIEERSREVWQWTTLESLWADVKYGARQMGKAPGFAVTVALTLALSIGVATAVFCVVDTVILRSLPYDHPERIVAVETKSASGYQQPTSGPSYRDERKQAQSFTAFAGYIDSSSYTANTPVAGPVRLDSIRSTDNFFTVFGVQPLLGRTYLPGEEQEGKSDVAVLGYDTWMNYFGGDQNVVNHTVKLNDRIFTIIGVMPDEFRFPLSKRNAIYTPIHLDYPWMSFNGYRSTHWLQSIARLKDGISLEQAQADLSHIFSNLSNVNPADRGRTVRLVQLAESINAKSRGPLWTLLTAALAVLTIGCVNVAGLLLARGVKREREMAMRSAIGAGRMRLVRQVLTESLGLATTGAFGGILLAVTILRLMRAFLIHALARGSDIHLNWTVLGAAIATSVLLSLTASLYPALRMAGTDPNRVLKSGVSTGYGRGQHRLRAGFIVVQVALTLVLLVVSGILIRLVSSYRHADLGFDPAHILTAEINLSPSLYMGRDPIAGFYQPLFDRVIQFPGVQAVGVIDSLPVAGEGTSAEEHIAGQPQYPKGHAEIAETRTVSTGYFDVFGIRLLRGRALSPGLDRPANAAANVVVDEAFVRKFIPSNLDPTVQRMDGAAKEENWTHIVGVTGNVRQDIYEDPLAEEDFLMNFYPFSDRPTYLSDMQLVVRTDGDPKRMIPALGSAIHQIDPTVPFKTPESMTEVISRTLVFERMESWLFAIFAALAMTLALVGLYGLINHEVGLRARDIGIRIALGSTRERVMAMILTRVAALLTTGIATGLALTYAAKKLIASVVVIQFGHQGGLLALLVFTLVVAGVIATAIPALRAARTDPMQALRSE